MQLRGGYRGRRKEEVVSLGWVRLGLAAPRAPLEAVAHYGPDRRLCWAVGLGHLRFTSGAGGTQGRIWEHRYNWDGYNVMTVFHTISKTGLKNRIRSNYNFRPPLAKDRIRSIFRPPLASSSRTGFVARPGLVTSLAQVGHCTDPAWLLAPQAQGMPCDPNPR